MRTRLLFIAGLFLLAVGCSESPKPEAAAKLPEPKFPAEIESAVEVVLGSEAEILLVGDFVHNGEEQVLAINRLKVPQKTTVPGTLLTRAALLAKDGGKWREILRCDEHLKNPQGYLAATPISPVNGWRLQYEQSKEKGLILYFTPLAQPAGGYILTIGVRWNPEVKRYQSLDREYKHFLGENAVLETPNGHLR